MGFPEPRNVLNYVRDNLRLWAHHAAHPLQATEALLGEASSSRTRRVVHLWSTTLAITLVLQLPVHGLVDIHLYDLEFYLPYLIYQLLFLYTVALSLYCAFRIFRVTIGFNDVLVIHTSLIVVYTPVYTMMFYPTTVTMLTTLSTLKSSDPTVRQVLDVAISASGSWVEICGAIALPLLLVMSCMLSGMFANIVANRSRSAKHRVMSATAFAILVIFPIPSAALGFVFRFIVYAAIGRAAHTP